MQPRIHIIALGVNDMKHSLRFYRDGLGFKTNVKDDDANIVFFQTQGVILELFPKQGIAKDINPQQPPQGSGFAGITLAHNVQRKEEVAEILQLAEKAGGKIVKTPQAAAWGGYHGYFTDPDGYYWEVAYWEGWQFNADGSLRLN